LLALVAEKPDPAAMAEYILEKTRPGSIILLHDGLEGEPQDRSEAMAKSLREMHLDCCTEAQIPRSAIQSHFAEWVAGNQPQGLRSTCDFARR